MQGMFEKVAGESQAEAVDFCANCRDGGNDCPAAAVGDSAPLRRLGQRRFDDGERLFSAGDERDHIAVLSEGWAVASVETEALGPVDIALVPPGSLLAGPVSLKRYIYGFTALEPGRLCLFGRRQLIERRAQSNDFDDWLSLTEMRGQEVMMRRAMSNARFNVRQRIASVLLGLHQALLRRKRADADTYRAPLTQELLASITSASKEHVNRELRGLEQDRLFSLRYGLFRVIDRERCERLLRQSR